MSDVWCHMSDVRCPMSDVRCPMSDVRCPMSDVRCPMSDVRCPMSDVRCPMSDVRCLKLVGAVVQLPMASDKLAAIHDPLLCVDFDIHSQHSGDLDIHSQHRGDRLVSVEMNKNDLETMITSLDLANKV